MLLTGSRALDHYINRKSEKSDWDFIASEEELNKINLSFCGKDSIKVDNVEFLNRKALNNNKFVGSCEVFFLQNSFVKDNVWWFNYSVCTPEELYIQKRSHIHRPLKFIKHIHELELIKKECKDIGTWPVNSSLLKERTKLTKDKYGDKVPSLNKTNEDFFDDPVTKYYVHDDLHEVVAYYDRPLYERLKVDGSMAKCEKDLWNELSHEDKVNCVREEAYVIALERFIIPHLIKGERHRNQYFAFYAALEKICSTLTSGWFRDFAIDNYFEIKNDPIDFLSKFNKDKDFLKRVK
jgi:hypothetical protein